MIAVATHATSWHLWRGPLWSELTPQLQQFPKGSEDDTHVPPCRLSCLAREVVHADLRHPRTKFPGARKHLHVDERACAAKVWQQSLQHVAPVNLEAAVDVAHR